MKRIVNFFGRSKAVVLAVVVSVVLVGAPAVFAANGDPFILGTSNSATNASKLVTSGADPALSLVVDSGVAPLAVNSAVKVARLNADRLDGLDATAFLRANGKADKLDGKDSTQFAPDANQNGKADIAENADQASNAGNANTLDNLDSAEFLGVNQKAADSDKLDGKEPAQLPGSIAGIASFSGPVGSIPSGSAFVFVFVFAGPQATVTTTASQNLVGAAQAPLGLSSGGPQIFRYELCYQPASGGPLTNFTRPNFSIGEASTTRVPFSAMATTTPGAGTWKVGFCVQNYNPLTLDDNDYVSGWVQVVNDPVATTGTAVAKSNVASPQEVRDR